MTSRLGTGKLLTFFYSAGLILPVTVRKYEMRWPIGSLLNPSDFTCPLPSHHCAPLEIKSGFLNTLWLTVPTREYWIIYRGPGTLAGV
jgi:hypothetical protein